MDWTALGISVRLGLATVLVLLPIAFLLGRALAFGQFPGRSFVGAAVALPLVLPPTVLGFYLLVATGRGSWLGSAFESLTGQSLAFSFEGLLLASVIVNLPFAVQPIQNALAAIPSSVREAARCSGMTRAPPSAASSCRSPGRESPPAWC